MPIWAILIFIFTPCLCMHCLSIRSQRCIHLNYIITRLLLLALHIEYHISIDTEMFTLRALYHNSKSLIIALPVNYCACSTPLEIITIVILRHTLETRVRACVSLYLTRSLSYSFPSFSVSFSSFNYRSKHKNNNAKHIILYVWCGGLDQPATPHIVL